MKLTTVSTALLLLVANAAQAQDLAEGGLLTTRSEGALASGRGPRLRLGVNFGWSPLSRVQAPGLSRDAEGIIDAGFHLRVGIQATETIAVYYQGSAIIGNTVKVCVGGPSLSLSGTRRQYDPAGCTNYWVPVHASSLMLETTVADHLQFALGPSLFYGQFGNAAIGSSPFGGGAVGRFSAVVARNEGPGQRRSFSIGLQGQLGFFPGGGQFMDLAVVLGYELF